MQDAFGGMALYFLMLTRGTAARTTSNFYLVPGVTALMAWPFLGEGLSLLAIGGLVTVSWIPKMRQVAKVEPCP